VGCDELKTNEGRKEGGNEQLAGGGIRGMGMALALLIHVIERKQARYDTV